MDDLGVTEITADLRITDQASDNDLRVVVYDSDLRVTLDAAFAINGEDGVGIPPGGLPGQMLSKLSGVDFETEWVDPLEGLPEDGTTGQVLTKRSDDPLDTEWRNVPPSVPIGGTTGQILAKASTTNYDMQWVTPPDPAIFLPKAGGVMEGTLVLDADPINPLEAATKSYADSVVGNKVDKAGDTMTGPLVLSGTPTINGHAANKEYVDTKAPINSPDLTGTPLAPTAAPGTSTRQLATTEYVQGELALQLPTYLPKAGGTMTGPIILSGLPSLSSHAASKAYVDASPGIGPYKLEADTIDRTNKDRWNDHLNVAEIAPIDPTGGGSTFHVALQGAWTKALARDRRSVIEVPAGTFRCGETVTLLNDELANLDKIEIRGAGMEATLIQGPGGDNRVLKIGSYSHPTTSGSINIRDLGLTGGTTLGPHTGAMVSVNNTRRLIFREVKFVGGNLVIEDDPAAVPNGSNYIRLLECLGTVKSGETQIYVPGSVQALGIMGGRWSGGTDRKFFVHDSALYNCDGVYIFGAFFEAYEIYVDSIGKGIANVEIQAGQFDRATTAFLRAQPAAGLVGSNRNWVVHDIQMLGGGQTEDAIIWDASGMPASTCEGLMLSAVSMHRIKKRALYCPKGSGVWTGGILRTCGLNGTEVIRMGTEGNFELVGLQSHRGAHDTEYAFPTHGIIYDGPSTGKRGHTACRFWDATVAQFSGTP